VLAERSNDVLLQCDATSHFFKLSCLDSNNGNKYNCRKSKAEDWRTEFLNKKWLGMKEDVAYKKILSCKNKAGVTF
jgi:hypothetical protein